MSGHNMLNAGSLCRAYPGSRTSNRRCVPWEFRERSAIASMKHVAGQAIRCKRRRRRISSATFLVGCSDVVVDRHGRPGISCRDQVTVRKSRCQRIYANPPALTFLEKKLILRKVLALVVEYSVDVVNQRSERGPLYAGC